MNNETTVTVIDYGMGNIGSIRNMLRKVGARVVIASTPEVLAEATKIVLPGVGAFDQGMERLDASGLRPVLDRLVMEQRVPILGICLGMQLFTAGSEEGSRAGLSWLPAHTIRFRREAIPANLRIPHMGWNSVRILKQSPLFDETDEERRFYFLHSFHVVCDDSADILAETTHGYPFAAAFIRDNVVGAQFHPEKSHRFGMDFFRRFVESF